MSSETVDDREVGRRLHLTSWGRAALVLFLLHGLLLFLPPIPPITKGSLWSYLLAYTAVALMAVETARSGGAVVRAWAARPPGFRWSVGLLAPLGVLVLGLAIREIGPELFTRFSREEGLWEPPTLFAYLGSAVLLFGAGRSARGRERRHWQLLGGFYGVMALEEIDYFGIFGGIIGRIDGVYVGSLHDVIGLAASGLLSGSAMLVIGVVTALAIATLIGFGYLQPGRLARTLARVDTVWALLGLLFLFLGAAVEAELFGWNVPEPRPEELLELVGAMALTIYALSLSTDVVRARSGAGSGPAE